MTSPRSPGSRGRTWTSSALLVSPGTISPLLSVVIDLPHVEPIGIPTFRDLFDQNLSSSVLSFAASFFGTKNLP